MTTFPYRLGFPRLPAPAREYDKDNEGQFRLSVEQLLRQIVEATNTEANQGNVFSSVLQFRPNNTVDVGDISGPYLPKTVYAATSVIAPLVSASSIVQSPNVYATTRVTSPKFGTTTALDVVFDRNAVTQLTLGSLLATFAGAVTVTTDLTVNGNTVIGNASSDTLTVTAELASHLIPNTASIDLGAVADPYREVFAATVTATSLGGTLTTVSQPNVTTMANLTTIGTLVAGAVPASLVTAGTFGAGDYVFPSDLTVTDTATVGTSSAGFLVSPTSSEQVRIVGAAGTSRSVGFYSGTTAGAGRRWIARAFSSAESGSNAGSPFHLNAYDDAGAAIDTVLSITRAAAGTIAFASNRPITGGTYNGQTISSAASFTGTVAVASTLNVVGAARFGSALGPSNNVQLWVSAIASTGATAYGVRADPSLPATTTASGFAGYYRLVTAASAFTMSGGYGIYIEAPSIGAGSVVTTGHGIRLAAATWTGSTTAYGVRIDNVTGAGTNYALYTGNGLVRFGDAVTMASSLAITGALSGVTTLGLSGQLTSTLATGTAPFVVASTTKVANLNADLLDDQTGSYYLDNANATGVLDETLGGTGLSSYTLGDIVYASAANTLSKLAGNITTTPQYLRQTGNGSVSAAPVWDTLTAADVGGGSFPNAAFTFVNTLTVVNGLTANDLQIATTVGTITSFLNTLKLKGVSVEVTPNGNAAGVRISGNSSVGTGAYIDLYGTTHANAGRLDIASGGSAALTLTSASGQIECADDIDLASGQVLRVNGTQVVSTQGAAVADATGAGDVVAQLNDLLAKLRTHGLIAT